MKISKNSNLTEEEILNFLSKKNVGIILKIESDLKYHINEKLNTIVTYNDDKVEYRCFCEKSKGNIVDKKCPYCGNGVFKNFTEIRTDDYTEKLGIQLNEIRMEQDKYYKMHREMLRGAYISAYTTPSVVLYDKFYVEKHPDFEYGIIIKKVKITASQKNNELVLLGKIEKYIEIVPGVKSAAYKIKRNKPEEMDLFNAFNLNSNLLKYNVEIDWQGADNMIDFLNINKEFTKRTAFLEIFNTSNFQYKHSFFMLYMYTYSKYPVFELLAKMGYTKILNEAITKVSGSCNKDVMRLSANSLTQIFNPHETEGKLSLTVPKYVGDYLKQVSAKYNDFAIWSDIYCYENISKENFEKIISSDEFLLTYKYFNKITNLLKYNYKLQKLLSYIKKQYELLKIEGCDVDGIIQYIIDYHNALELLNIEGEMFPANIKEVHDKVTAAYKISVDKLNDVQIKKLKEVAALHIPENEEYTIVLPEKTSDFVEEGERQHNCVATYVKPVLNNNCYIFFVRKKEDPTKNYITAEYRHNKLYQIREKNNYTVSNNKIIKFAKEFCENLSKEQIFKRM